MKKFKQLFCTNRHVSVEIFFVILLNVFSLTSCKHKNNDIRYLAVQLLDSEMWSIVDLESGDVIYEDEFKNMPSAIINDIFYVENEDGDYDYYNVSNVNKPINKESYCDVSSFDNDGYALTVKHGDVITIIDSECKEIASLDKKIVLATPFVNNFSCVYNEDGKCGFIDHKGKMIVPMKYDIAYLYSNDKLAIVGKQIDKEKIEYSVLDENGKSQFSFTNTKYKDFGTFSDGYLPVLKGEKIFFLDKTGKEAFSVGKTTKEYMPSNIGVKDGYVIFIDGLQYGVADTKGEIVIRAKYDELFNASNGYFIATKQDKVGVINKDDEIVIPFENSAIYSIYFTNKFIICEGDEDEYKFSIVDYKKQDVCKHTFSKINVSTKGVRSNYFNAEYKAKKLVSQINTENINDIDKFATVRDFRSKLRYSASFYSNRYIIEGDELYGNTDSPYDYCYSFSGPIASTKYTYFYGYRFSDGVDFNNSTKIKSVTLEYDISEYALGIEERFVEVIENELQKKEFVKNEKGILVAQSGNSIAIGYDDGVVAVIYGFGYEVDQPVRNVRDKSDKKSVNSDDTEVVEEEPVMIEAEAPEVEEDY